MTTEERRRRRFSTPFKKKQVELIETGELTIAEVGRLYEVKGDSVRNWVKKFGVGNYPGKIHVIDASEIDRIKELEYELKRLTEIIGKQQIKMIYQEQLIFLAKKEYGDFEKK